MNKRGAELSMNVIIVAAIGLLVLVVLSVIFLGRVGTFGQKTGDCIVQGGTCSLEPCGTTPETEGTTKNPLLTCPDVADEPQVCCMLIK